MYPPQLNTPPPNYCREAGYQGYYTTVQRSMPPLNSTRPSPFNSSSQNNDNHRKRKNQERRKKRQQKQIKEKLKNVETIRRNRELENREWEDARRMNQERERNESKENEIVTSGTTVNTSLCCSTTVEENIVPYKDHVSEKEVEETETPNREQQFVKGLMGSERTFIYQKYSRTQDTVKEIELNSFERASAKGVIESEKEVPTKSKLSDLACEQRVLSSCRGLPYESRESLGDVLKKERDIYCKILSDFLLLKSTRKVSENDNMNGSIPLTMTSLPITDNYEHDRSMVSTDERLNAFQSNTTSIETRILSKSF